MTQSSETTPLIPRIAYGKTEVRKRLLKHDPGWFTWVRVLWNYDDQKGTQMIPLFLI